MPPKGSPYWQHFKISQQGVSMAQCTICNALVSCGNKPSQFSNTPLQKHLRNHHKAEYEALVQKTQGESPREKPKETRIQVTLDELEKRKAKWSRDDEMWRRNGRRLAEMVALDMEPLSIVERSGFKRFVEGLQPKFQIPGRKWLTDNGLPSLLRDVKAAIRRDLDKAEWVSFTTDIWTTEHTNIGFSSLTTHWISDGYERKMALLQVQEFSESHTGVNIAERLLKMTAEWGVENKVWTFMQDSNIN